MLSFIVVDVAENVLQLSTGVLYDIMKHNNDEAPYFRQ